MQSAMGKPFDHQGQVALRQHARHRAAQRFFKRRRFAAAAVGAVAALASVDRIVLPPSERRSRGNAGAGLAAHGRGGDGAVTGEPHDPGLGPVLADAPRHLAGEGEVGSDLPVDEAEEADDSPSVNTVKGIGPAYADRLEAAGIHTVADLANADAAELAAMGMTTADVAARAAAADARRSAGILRHADRDLPLELKQALRKKYQWFNELPEEEQQQLRNRWHNLPAEQKQEIRDRIRTNTQTRQNNLQKSLMNNQGGDR